METPTRLYNVAPKFILILLSKPMTLFSQDKKLWQILEDQVDQNWHRKNFTALKTTYSQKDLRKEWCLDFFTTENHLVIVA